jgi:hypothetical protein
VSRDGRGDEGQRGGRGGDERQRGGRGGTRGKGEGEGGTRGKGEGEVVTGHSLHASSTIVLVLRSWWCPAAKLNDSPLHYSSFPDVRLRGGGGGGVHAGKTIKIKGFIIQVKIF